jgi:hypothetical protein
MRHDENEIAQAVGAFLATLPGRKASIRSIKDALPRFIALSDEDRALSQTRQGEELWEQQVRNIVSHRKTMEGNWIFEGYLDYEPNFLTLTDKGLQALQKVQV